MQHGQEWERNGQDCCAQDRTEQTEQAGGTNTETTICTSGWLHAAGFFGPLSRCVVADEGQPGHRQRPGGGGHGPECPASRAWLAGSTLIYRAVIRARRMSHPVLSLRNIGHCETVARIRSWQLQVVLTGGTRLGQSLIRRLFELNHVPSWWTRDESGQPASQVFCSSIFFF